MQKNWVISFHFSLSNFKYFCRLLLRFVKRTKQAKLQKIKKQEKCEFERNKKKFALLLLLAIRQRTRDLEFASLEMGGGATAFQFWRPLLSIPLFLRRATKNGFPPLGDLLYALGPGFLIKFVTVLFLLERQRLANQEVGIHAFFSKKVAEFVTL